MRNKKRYVRKAETEYNRLDIEPARGGVSLFHDENGLPKIPKKQKVKLPPPQQLTNDPIPVRALKDSVVSGTPRNLRRSVPNQVFAHVGVHKDKVWFDEQAAVLQTPPQPHFKVADTEGDVGEGYEKVNYDQQLDPDQVDFTIDQDPNQDFNQIQEDQELSNYDDAIEQHYPDDPDAIEQHHPDDPDDHDHNDLDLLDVLFNMNPLDYVLIVDKEVIEQNRDIIKIKNTIEKLVLEYDIDLNRINVFKGIPVEFGVIVGD